MKINADLVYFMFSKVSFYWAFIFLLCSIFNCMTLSTEFSVINIDQSCHILENNLTEYFFLCNSVIKFRKQFTEYIQRLDIYGEIWNLSWKDNSGKVESANQQLKKILLLFCVFSSGISKSSRLASSLKGTEKSEKRKSKPQHHITTDLIFSARWKIMWNNRVRI